MVQTILSRLATSLLVIFGASVLVYCIMYLLPGDPVLLMLDPSSATPEMIENLRVQLGLDQPFYIQFANYFGDIFAWGFR